MQARTQRVDAGSRTKGHGSGPLLMAVMALCALASCSRSSDRSSGRSELVGTTSSALSAFVQTNFTNAAYVSVPYKSAQTAGDLNVIVLGWSDTTAKVTSVTDHSGNTYTLAVGPEESAPYVMQMVAFKVAGANLCAGVRPVNPRFSQQV